MGIGIAVLLPATAYFLTDIFAKKFTELPRKYYPTGYDTIEVRGRKVVDTTFKKVANMAFNNQLGEQITLDTIKGKILVVNFFFTQCASICPAMTSTMQKLQKSFDVKSGDAVHFLSISIDPLHDDPQQMKKFADSYNINHSRWWLLQGDTATIYNWSANEFKLGADNPNGDPNAQNVHTDQIILLDRERVIRGYYHSKQKDQMDRLARDIAMLMMEKDPRRKGMFD